MAIFAITKLFFFDMPYLNDGHRVVSFFAFGAILLGISFVYQHFSKHFALKIDITKQEENHDY